MPWAGGAYCGREENLLEQETEPHFNRRAYRNRPLPDTDKTHNSFIKEQNACGKSNTPPSDGASDLWNLARP